jgi:hypothetical protein
VAAHGCRGRRGTSPPPAQHIPNRLAPLYRRCARSLNELAMQVLIVFNCKGSTTLQQWKKIIVVIFVGLQCYGCAIRGTLSLLGCKLRCRTRYHRQGMSTIFVGKFQEWWLSKYHPKDSSLLVMLMFSPVLCHLKCHPALGELRQC